MQSPNSAINNTTEVTLPRDPDEQPPKRAAVRRELKLKFHHFLTQSSPTAQKAAHQRLFFTVPPAAPPQYLLPQLLRRLNSVFSSACLPQVSWYRNHHTFLQGEKKTGI